MVSNNNNIIIIIIITIIMPPLRCPPGEAIGAGATDLEWVQVHIIV